MSMSMSLALGVWLGIAALALSSACFLLWRTRLVLRKSRQDALVQEAMLATSALLVPTRGTKSASSVPTS